jgi:hypothetical protein
MEKTNQREAVSMFALMSQMLPKKMIIKMMKDACDKYLTDPSDDNEQEVEMIVSLLMTKKVVKEVGSIDKLADKYQEFTEKKDAEKLEQVVKDSPAFETEQDAPEPDWDNLAKYKDAEDHGPENYPD